MTTTPLLIDVDQDGIFTIEDGDFFAEARPIEADADIEAPVDYDVTAHFSDGSTFRCSVTGPVDAQRRLAATLTLDLAAR